MLGQGRDLAELQRTLGDRAQALWARVPRERHERAGLTAWDIGELPASITVDVGGRRLLAYPALVETEAGVDLRLLESPAAAAVATRAGVRRLILIALGTTLAKLAAQLPGAIDQGPLVVAGAPLSPRRQLVLRALDDAFGLGDPEALPRSKAAFTARLAEGRGRLPDVHGQLGGVAVELGAELTKARAALRPLAVKAGPVRAAHDDVQGQLEHLIAADLLRATPLPRLLHIVRYLRAIHVRLQRVPNDPQKDAQKAALVTGFWQAYRTRREEWRARDLPLAALDDFGWLVEELRVQTFAPELGTAAAVSPQRLKDLWGLLGR